MNLKSLSDSELNASSIVAAKNERAALSVVLQHLLEVDRRKSFSPKFESIADYAIQHMGYEPKSAWRRVNAMRLMQELPEIMPAIESGKLDLTKMLLAQNHFRNEAKEAMKPARETESISFFPLEAPKPALSKNEKLEILKTVMAQTSREAERDLISKSSAPEKLKKPDQVKPLPGNANEVRIVLTDDDLALIKELKGLCAHKSPHASVSDIVSLALATAVVAIRKEKSGESKPARKSVGAAKEPVGLGRAADKPTRSEEQIEKASRTRTPSRELKRQIWNRANGSCEICASTYALEYDHRLPYAKGGKTTFENLRLLCRPCNKREAIHVFGPREIRCPQVFYTALAHDLIRLSESC